MREVDGHDMYVAVGVVARLILRLSDAAPDIGMGKFVATAVHEAQQELNYCLSPEDDQALIAQIRKERLNRYG